MLNHAAAGLENCISLSLRSTTLIMEDMEGRQGRVVCDPRDHPAFLPSFTWSKILGKMDSLTRLDLKVVR